MNNIRLIDGYLFNQNSIENGLVFDAMLILNPELSEQIEWQKKAHSMIKDYSRKKIKAEIEVVHQKLFNTVEHTGFRHRILKFFSK